MKNSEEKSSWVMVAFRMPPELKVRIDMLALRLGKTQSEVMRMAVGAILKENAISESEIAAADIAMRERRELINLMDAKSEFRSSMLLSAAWEAVETDRRKLEKLGPLMVEDFDSWIRLLGKNKASVEPGNPQRERLHKRFDVLIARLASERKKYATASHD